MDGLKILLNQVGYGWTIETFTKELKMSQKVIDVTKSNFEIFAKENTFKDFIEGKTGSPKLVFGKNKLEVLTGKKDHDYIDCYILSGKEVYFIGEFADGDGLPTIYNDEIKSGVILKKGNKNVFLKNADVADMFIDSMSVSSGSISINCVYRLFNIKKIDKEIELVDFCGEDFVTPSSAARKDASKDIRSARMKHKYKKGYTLLYCVEKNKWGYKWHRPSTVVLKYTNNKKNIYGIFGQDEDTYFGCILPSPVKTVEQAYSVLAPKEANGKYFIRQGEWFFIESKKPTGEEYTDFECNLPKLGKSENNHSVCAESAIFLNGNLYLRDFEVQHDEHETVFNPTKKFNQWYLVKRNNAVLSVSEEGVD